MAGTHAVSPSLALLRARYATPERLHHTGYRALHRAGRLTKDDCLNWLIVEAGARKKAPLITVLKRYLSHYKVRADLIARTTGLVDQLSRCGRSPARESPSTDAVGISAHPAPKEREMPFRPALKPL